MEMAAARTVISGASALAPRNGPFLMSQLVRINRGLIKLSATCFNRWICLSEQPPEELFAKTYHCSKERNSVHSESAD